jgi:hypothetical protein
MQAKRYWGLFWIASALSVHAFVVGRQLESSFFIMMFFWGFVAICAFRDALQAAQSMAIVMVILLGALTIATFTGGTSPPSLAYTTFALYPAIVSWISVLFYIRYLRQRDSGNSGPRLSFWRHRRAD